MDLDEILALLGPSSADFISAGSYFQDLEGQHPIMPLYHSSNVDGAAYNPVGGILIVLFRRKIDRPESSPRLYLYHGVSRALAYDLFLAGSPGSWVWGELRRKHVPFTRT